MFIINFNLVIEKHVGLGWIGLVGESKESVMLSWCFFVVARMELIWWHFDCAQTFWLANVISIHNGNVRLKVWNVLFSWDSRLMWRFGSNWGGFLGEWLVMKLKEQYVRLGILGSTTYKSISLLRPVVFQEQHVTMSSKRISSLGRIILRCRRGGYSRSSNP